MGASRPRVHARRLGVMLHETSEFKPLLTMVAASDGGIILSPSEVSGAQWAYGTVGAHPAFIRSAPGSLELPSVVTMPIGLRPKLHYHRSGFVSVNLTGFEGPRRGMQCPPIAHAQGEQFFGMTSNRPGNMNSARPRPGDSFLVAHNGWPGSIAIFGLLYPHGHVPLLRSEFGSDTARGLVRGERVEMVVDLEGHGLNVCVLVRFSQHPLSLRHAPACSLFGFSYGKTAPSGAVGVWSDSQRPPQAPLVQIPLLPQTDRPRFNDNPFHVSQDRWEVHRPPDGPPVRIRQI